MEKLGVSLSSPFSHNSGPVHGRLLEHYHEKSTLFTDVADKEMCLSAPCWVNCVKRFHEVYTADCLHKMLATACITKAGGTARLNDPERNACMIYLCLNTTVSHS